MLGFNQHHVGVRFFTSSGTSSGTGVSKSLRKGMLAKSYSKLSKLSNASFMQW
jgi:hypothetical protein